MTVELLQILSLICFILAGVLFIVTVALFFLLNIVKVFGYLTGINAKRAIENIRTHNESSNSEKNTSSGGITSKFSLSRKLQRERFDGSVVGTSKLSTSKLSREAKETTVLETSSVSNETTVLDNSSNETTVLGNSNSDTTVLGNLENETSVLGDSSYPQKNTNFQGSEILSNDNDPGFYIDYEIIFAESTEIIQ